MEGQTDKKSRLSLREIFQRHHDFYTRLLVKGNPNTEDLKQAALALDRRLEGKVEHLKDKNGVLIVIDP